MSLLFSGKTSETVKEKTELTKDVHQEVLQYCKHATPELTVSEFLAQAAEFALKKDAGWKKIKKTLQDGSATPAESAE
jgi:hypothetical protein